MASFVKTKGFKYAKNLLFGVGASVVIVGAWAKLTHLSWANFALTMGLMTEAIIFAISGIIPPEKDYYWEKLFPGIDDADGKVQGLLPQMSAPKTVGGSGSTAALDKMLDEAKIDQVSINRLGDNLKKLSESVNSMSSVTDLAKAQIATDEFAAKAKIASDELAAKAKAATEEFSNQAKLATDAMSAMSKNIDNLSKVYGNMLTAMRS